MLLSFLALAEVQTDHPNSEVLGEVTFPVRVVPKALGTTSGGRS